MMRAALTLSSCAPPSPTADALRQQEHAMKAYMRRPAARPAVIDLTSGEAPTPGPRAAPPPAAQAAARAAAELLSGEASRRQHDYKELLARQLGLPDSSALRLVGPTGDRGPTVMIDGRKLKRAAGRGRGAAGPRAALGPGGDDGSPAKKVQKAQKPRAKPKPTPAGSPQSAGGAAGTPPAAGARKRKAAAGKAAAEPSDSGGGDPCAAAVPLASVAEAPPSARRRRKGDDEFQRELEVAMAATAFEAASPEQQQQQQQQQQQGAGSGAAARSPAAASPGGRGGARGAAFGRHQAAVGRHWVEAYCGGGGGGGGVDEGRWVHADPVAGWVDRAGDVEGLAPRGAALAYVAAFAGGGAKDVTRRYTSSFLGAERQREGDWWDATLRPLRAREAAAGGGGAPAAAAHAAAPARRAEVAAAREDRELEARAAAERRGLPTTVAGFKAHAEFVLARHVGRHQALAPGARAAGVHRGEAYYLRSDLGEVHTAERWRRMGREVLPEEAERPAKRLKKRGAAEPGGWGEEEGGEEGEGEGAGAGGEGGGVEMSSFYLECQTRAWEAPAAAGGRVPRNARGNVEAPPFTSALPRGTVSSSSSSSSMVQRPGGTGADPPCCALHAPGLHAPDQPRLLAAAAARAPKPYPPPAPNTQPPSVGPLCVCVQAHVHLPHVALVCRRLGVDYAPALTGFDIRAGRSVPRLEGVVVCCEHEGAVRAGCAEEAAAREEAARRARAEAAEADWRLLLRSLLTRVRLAGAHPGGAAPEGAMAEAAAALLRDTHDAPAARERAQKRQRPASSVVDLTRSDDAEGGQAAAAPAAAAAAPPAAPLPGVKTEEI
jgi:xeroderma pigmentosum group C-complementing protein